VGLVGPISWTRSEWNGRLCCSSSPSRELPTVRLDARDEESGVKHGRYVIERGDDYHLPVKSTQALEGESRRILRLSGNLQTLVVVYIQGDFYIDPIDLYTFLRSTGTTTLAPTATSIRINDNDNDNDNDACLPYQNQLPRRRRHVLLCSG
jgi:hypothetical protein